MTERSMAKAVRLEFGCDPRAPSQSRNEPDLRDVLKHCSAATFEAASRYRQTREPHLLPLIVEGVIERYLERDARARVGSLREDLRLSEDLGLDSLTLMEIVSQVEDALRVTINDADLRHFRTLGDVRRYVECRAADQVLAAAPAPTPPAPNAATPTDRAP